MVETGSGGSNGKGGGRGRRGGAVVDAPRPAVSRRAPTAKKPPRATPPADTKRAAPRKSPPVQKKAAPTAAPVAAPARADVTPAGSAIPVEAAPAVLTEEEQIESAKYLPRELPPRVFEEERFLFPDTYGVNRVRLLVKDPEWLFAHWDVDAAVLAEMQATLGERTLALSRLTLRISDPEHGGASVVLLPHGARAWYVRTDTAGRKYRAQLGMTLPSGEFRLLAESNTVTAPRVGPSPVRATRKVHFAQPLRAEDLAPARAVATSAAAAAAEPGPWSPLPQGDPAVVGSRAGSEPPSASGPTAKGESRDARGGASETYRR